MRPKLLKTLMLLVSALGLGLLLTACGGGGGSGASQGTLATVLTDAASDAYRAVYVTIDRVDVHHDADGSWQTVATPGKTYNLLDLVNGVRQTLGITALDAGHYTQLRLVLGATPGPGTNLFSLPHPYANYVIDNSNAVHELTVPSGLTTGLKVVNGFDVSAGGNTELLLDFDALSSVVVAGSSGKYQLKPTVKVLDTAAGVSLTGTLSEAGTTPPAAVAGALVTAQTADTLAADPKDQVVVAAGSLSGAGGGYALFLSPGDYTLVATADGYLSACSALALAPGTATTADLALQPATGASGSLTGSVTIAGGAADQVVSIDIRQQANCTGASLPTTITVKSLNVANGGSFEVTLAAGTYQVVAATAGQPTQVVDGLTVTSAAATDLGPLAF